MKPKKVFLVIADILGFSGAKIKFEVSRISNEDVIERV